ncbi:MAG: hypothetical protein JST07_04590 [Bacteroidetes bacterium]|nr:hypothetical protein [Bacteroidota bacterium]
MEEYYKKRKITDSSSFSVSYKHWYGGLVGENRVAGDLKETNARLENGCLVLEKELFYPGGTIEYSSDRIIHGRMIYTKAIK